MKSIKFAIISAVFVSAAASAQMWPLTEGTQEIQVNGSLVWDGISGDRLELKLGYGYFISEGIEVGPRLSIVDEQDNTMYQLDAYLEYHYPLTESLAPYAGFALGYINNSDADDSSAIGATLSLGTKFFLVEDLALDMSLNHTQATGDVFVAEDDYKSHRSSVSIGLRFFY
jgi:opacity protein-like surface antigen